MPLSHFHPGIHTLAGAPFPGFRPASLLRLGILLVIAVLLPVVVPSSYIINLAIVNLLYAYEGALESAWWLCRPALVRARDVLRRRRLRLHGSVHYLGRQSVAGHAGRCGSVGGVGRLRRLPDVPRGVRGHYFALATFAFAELFLFLVQSLPQLGSSAGLLVPAKGDGNAPGLFQFANQTGYYYVIVAFTALVVAVAYALQRSPIGYVLAAIRSDEEAAEMAGVNTLSYKTLAMAISAAFMACAGTFYAQFISFINPTSTLGVDVSLNGVLRTVVGGAATPSALLLAACSWRHSRCGRTCAWVHGSSPRAASARPAWSGYTRSSPP
jgi:hypothetical protein